MGNQDKSVFVVQKIAFQPGDVLLVEVVGGLVEQEYIRFFQQKLGEQDFGTLAAASIGHIPVKTKTQKA